MTLQGRPHEIAVMIEKVEKFYLRWVVHREDFLQQLWLELSLKVKGGNVVDRLAELGIEEATKLTRVAANRAKLKVNDDHRKRSHLGDGELESTIPDPHNFQTEVEFSDLVVQLKKRLREDDPALLPVFYAWISVKVDNWTVAEACTKYSVSERTYFYLKKKRLPDVLKSILGTIETEVHHEQLT